MTPNTNPSSFITGAIRTFTLTPMEGFDVKNAGGMTDKRLFTGENKIHAIKDNQTGLWYLRYEKGVVPEEFKQHFTTASVLVKFIEDYYRRRNITVKEVAVE